MNQEKKEAPEKAGAAAMKARIEVWLAAILMVISFAVGFVVRGVTTEEPAPATIEQQAPGLPQGVIPAPPLTDSQLNGGQLPAGHPGVDSGNTATSPAPAGGNANDNQNNNNP